MAYALVTGAAKGIGYAIATELAIRKYDLILTDFDEPALTEAASYLQNKYYIRVQSLVQDLSADDAVDNIYIHALPVLPELNVIINNAGYGLNGAFETLSIYEQLNIIDVNVKAQLKIAHAFIPLLKCFDRSYLLNVGSTTSYQSVPYLAIYAASKAFVLSFTRSLRRELKGGPVSVSCLSPGSTDTDFVKRARMGQLVLKTAEKFNMSPQAVAKIAVKGLFAEKAEIIPGFTNKLNAWLPKFFPKSFVEGIAAKIYKPGETSPGISTALA